MDGNFDPSIGGNMNDDDDDDLEAELLALQGAGSPKKPKPKPRGMFRPISWFLIHVFHNVTLLNILL